MPKKTLIIAFIGLVLLVAVPLLWLRARRSAALEPYVAVCNGIGLTQAARYTGGPGPHPIVFLASNGTPGAWSDELPKGWEPETLTEVELVACGEEEEVLLEVCPYAGGSDIRRYQYTAHIVLRSAATGEQLGLLIIAGESPRRCAAEESVNISRIDGSHVDFEQIRQWLSSYVETGNGVLFTTVPVTGIPIDLVYADRQLWVVTSEGISKLSTAGEGKMVEITPSELSRIIQFDGVNFWMNTTIDYGKFELQMIDPQTGELDQIYPVGSNITPLWLDGQHLWFAGLAGVSYLDLGSKQYGVSLIQGYFSGAIFDGTYLWLTEEDGQLVQFDLQQEKIVTEITVGDDPRAPLFAGQKIWVANRGDDTVQSIDPVTGQAGDPIAVGDMPSDLAFDGQHVWVVNRNSMSFQAIDPTTNTAEPPISVDQPTSIAFDGTYLWLISGEGEETTVQYFTPAKP
ncbi:MAG: hypothetical protein KA314_25370 [Chloroflexi bacterium]|nr:hypothetical protein [Chloroflexota bacterium]MBP8059179.1 hypothetical protein [Chloroflexota bacterium]